MTRRRKDCRHNPHQPRALVPPRAVAALERIAAALEVLALASDADEAPSTAHLRQGVPLPADNVAYPDAWPLGRAVASCTVCGGLGTVQGALDSRRFPCPVCAASRANVTSAPSKRLRRDPATLFGPPFWCSAEIFIYDCDRCIGEDRECPKCGGVGVYTQGTDELGRFVYGPGVLGGPLPRHRLDVDKALSSWVFECREHRSKLTVDAFLVDEPELTLGEADLDAGMRVVLAEGVGPAGAVVLGQCAACPDGPGNEACEFCMGSGMALWDAEMWAARSIDAA